MATLLEFFIMTVVRYCYNVQYTFLRLISKFMWELEPVVWRPLRGTKKRAPGHEEVMQTWCIKRVLAQMTDGLRCKKKSKKGGENNNSIIIVHYHGVCGVSHVRFLHAQHFIKTECVIFVWCRPGCGYLC